MNENLQSALAELIEKTVSGIDASAAFLEAELPDFVFQLLLWYGVYNALLFVSAFMLVALGMYFTKILIRYVDDEDKGEQGELMVLFLLVWICIAVVFMYLINLEWLQIWIAPKVWLVEYAAKMVG